VGAGEVVIRCGEEGDALYVVADGALTVSECPGVPPVLRPGDVFGEIALLRSVPRTATVTARSVAILYALERDAFLCAVGGHPHTARVAHELAAARLRGQPTGTAA
jgi:CRP-like cAMP-binding protein